MIDLSDLNLDKKSTSMFRWGLGVWVFVLLCVVSLWGVIGYVAVHFICKVW